MAVVATAVAMAGAAVTTTAPEEATMVAQAAGIAPLLQGELFGMTAAPAPMVTAAVGAASTTAPTWEQASVSTTSAMAAPPPDASRPASLLREIGQPAAATN
jgi:hypothetical protein